MDHDVLIVGAGPVGLALALALKDTGLKILVADARAEEAAANDPRTLALSHGTRISLEQLGMWSNLPSTPITTIHVSQQGGFGRTMIRAEEEGVPALGHVVTAGALARALRARIDTPTVGFAYCTEVATHRSDTEAITLSLTPAGASPQTCTARLLACAEGGLTGSGSGVIERDYTQTALIGFVKAAGGHRNTAFERFTPEGPLALLPCGDDYALVHVVSSARAEHLRNLADTAYLSEIQRHLGGRVRLTEVGSRLAYPLMLRYRKATTTARTVWLGNAAQTLHPVAGQGFNLALRDVLALSQRLLRHTGDPGDPALLADYQRQRRLDRGGTIGFTDTLVRLFSSDLAPLRHLRGVGLFALDTVPPLRSFVARRMMFGARAWP